MDEGIPKIVERKQEPVVFPEDLRAQVASFYRNTFKEDLEDGFCTEKKLEDKLQGEESFYTRILTAIAEARSANPSKKIVVLFDIDETIVRGIINEDDGVTNIFRPSAFSLFARIKEGGAEIGFLTSRAELKTQLSEGLKDMQGVVNESYLFSSRDVYITLEEEKAIEDLLPKELEYRFRQGDFDKIKVLNSLIADESNKDKIFIPVDDFIYPGLYPYGVALEDNEKFLI